MTLEEAIEEVKRGKESGWVDSKTATAWDIIEDAVASGQLIPKADADLAVADARDKALTDLLYRSWLGLRVLSTALAKIHGKSHTVTDALLAEIEAHCPEFAPRSALRSLKGPTP